MQQPQYRGYAQQVPQRSPHPNPRRGGIGPMMSSGPGPHHSMALTPSQIAQQQQQAAHASELAKRRSRKPTDKSLPDGVEDVVLSDSGIHYKEMRDFERRLDATMTRKRLDILDSANRSAKRYKTLRIWVSNTVDDQLWQGDGLGENSFDFSGHSEASYRVKIEGRLLDEEEDAEDGEAHGKAHGDEMDEDGPAKSKAKSAAKAGQRYRFSHFFKAMSVDFDRSRARNGPEQSVEWKKPDQPSKASSVAAAADFDELTFKRNGDENVNITINLYRHENPDRYELSPELADIVDMTEATRTEVTLALWEYIKMMGLQEDEEKRNFRCDELLKKVVGRDSGYIPHLGSEYINAHLRPLPPVQLPYTIRVDEEFHKSAQPTIYDVRVTVDDPLREKFYSLANNPAFSTMLKDVSSLDEQVATLIQAITNSKARTSFFQSFAEDPATFVRQWLSSQQRDLDVIMGEATRGGGEDASGDEWRRGGQDSIWATQNARESVQVILAKPPAHGPR